MASQAAAYFGREALGSIGRTYAPKTKPIVRTCLCARRVKTIGKADERDAIDEGASAVTDASIVRRPSGHVMAPTEKQHTVTMSTGERPAFGVTDRNTALVKGCR